MILELRALSHSRVVAGWRRFIKPNPFTLRHCIYLVGVVWGYLLGIPVIEYTTLRHRTYIIITTTYLIVSETAKWCFIDFFLRTNKMRA